MERSGDREDDHMDVDVPQEEFPRFELGEEVPLSMFSDGDDDVLTVKVGEKLGSGVEAVAYRATRKYPSPICVLRCWSPRTPRLARSLEIRAARHRIQFGGIIYESKDTTYSHLAPTMAFSFQNPKYHFMTLHVHYQPIDQMFMDTDVRVLDAKNLPFLKAFTKVLFTALVELQDFSRLPIPSEGVTSMKPPPLGPKNDSSYVLHTDVKPSNLFWDEFDKKLRLGDFGGIVIIGDGTNTAGSVFHTRLRSSRYKLCSGQLFGFPSSDSYSVVQTMLALLCGGKLASSNVQQHFGYRLGLQRGDAWLDLMLQCLESEPAKRPTPQKALENPCYADMSIKEADAIIAKFIKEIETDFKSRALLILPDVATGSAMATHVGRLENGAKNPFVDVSELQQRAFNSTAVRGTIGRVHTGGDAAIWGATAELNPSFIEQAARICKATPDLRRYELQRDGRSIDDQARLALCCLELFNLAVDIKAKSRDAVLDVVKKILIEDATKPPNFREMRGLGEAMMRKIGKKLWEARFLQHQPSARTTKEAAGAK